jgi:hypothetical protein
LFSGFKLNAEGDSVKIPNTSSVAKLLVITCVVIGGFFIECVSTGYAASGDINVADSEYQAHYADYGISQFSYPLALLSARVASEAYNKHPGDTKCAGSPSLSWQYYDCALREAGFKDISLVKFSNATLGGEDPFVIAGQSVSGNTGTLSMLNLARASMQASVGYKYVTVSGKTRRIVVIAFRGTQFQDSEEPDQKAIDLAIDFSAGTVPYAENDPNNLVHEGFFTSVQVMESLEGLTALDNTTLHEIINNAENSDDLFLVTGHSLGGGIATLYAARLIDRGVKRDNLLVYTFGAPSAGNANFKNVFFNEEPYVSSEELAKKLNLHRVRNMYDFIPYSAYLAFIRDSLPALVVSGGLANPFPVLAYLSYDFTKSAMTGSWPFQHIGYPLVLSDMGDETAQFSEGGVNLLDRLKLASRGLSDHDMALYYAHVLNTGVHTNPQPPRADIVSPSISFYPDTLYPRYDPTPVTVTMNEPGSMHCCTTPGCKPVFSLSNIDTFRITLKEPTTIKCMAVDSAGNTSATKIAHYNVYDIDPVRPAPYLEIQVPDRKIADYDEYYRTLYLEKGSRIRLVVHEDPQWPDLSALLGVTVKIWIHDNYSIDGQVVNDAVEFTVDRTSQGYGLSSGRYRIYGFGAVLPDGSKKFTQAYQVQMVTDLYEPLAGGTVTPSASGGSITIPRTGQTRCYDAAGTEIPCTGTGQDGAIQAGGVWPVSRFADNGDGTVTDAVTGLAWTKDVNPMMSRDPSFGSANGIGRVSWQRSLDYIVKLNAEQYLGHSDWRLPNFVELVSMRGVFQETAVVSMYFSNQQLISEAWSSTTDSNSVESAFRGNGYSYQKLDEYGYVWPVRSAQPIALPRTGQTVSYAVGDDGDLQKGVAWPDPRFVDNGNETISDQLTGLVWARDANLMRTHSPSFDNDLSYATNDGAVTWQHALDYVAVLNVERYLGFDDWRLPNNAELSSLLSMSNLSGPNGFLHIDGSYWTSSTSTVYPNTAHFLTRGSGGYILDKSQHRFVWPVRGGTVNAARFVPAQVMFRSENLPDGSYQVGPATKTWRFKSGGQAINGLKAVLVPDYSNNEVVVGHSQNVIAVGNVAANADFLVNLPINPWHGKPSTGSVYWKLVDGNGMDVIITNSKTNRFWLKITTNRPPAFSQLQLLSVAGRENEEVCLPLLASDPDGDYVSFSVISGEGSIAPYAKTYCHSFSAGLHAVTVQAEDSVGGRATMTFQAIITSDSHVKDFYNDVRYADATTQILQDQYNAIHYLTLNGITIGYPEDPKDLTNLARIYNPAGVATQAEALAVLMKSAGKRGVLTLDAELRLLPYLVKEDVENGIFYNYSWVAPYLLKAEMMGIIADIDSFEPAREATREWLATIVAGMMRLETPLDVVDLEKYLFADAASFSSTAAYDAARSTAFFGYMVGTLGSDVSFRPGDPVSRADMAVVAAKVLRSPSVDGLVTAGFNRDYLTADGYYLPAIAQGQSFTLSGVTNLTAPRFLADGAGTVKDEWLFTPDSYTKAYIVRPGYGYSGPVMVESLANAPVTVPTDPPGIMASELRDLVVLFESLDSDGRNPVRGIYRMQYGVIFPDYDSDGVRDEIDQWPSDPLFTRDDNGNGIPDNLDSYWGVGSRNPWDIVCVNDFCAQFVNAVVYGPIRSNLNIVPLNGECSSQTNGQTFKTADELAWYSTKARCRNGFPTAEVSGTGPWTWTCEGIGGGTNASCSANIQQYSVTFVSSGNGKVSGAAFQTVNHGATTTQVTAVPDPGFHLVNWTGIINWDGTSSAAYSYPLEVPVYASMTVTANFAPDPVSGVCGTAHSQFFTSAPADNLCTTGTSTAVSGSGPWNWDCEGRNGGSTASCTAYVVSDHGVCGSADGQSFNVAPTANLCLNGTPSAVTGSGPWYWICNGVNGGATVSCSADLLPLYKVSPSQKATGTILPGLWQPVWFNDNAQPVPSAAQQVGLNETASFTITPQSGYRLVLPVGGTCPQGAMNGSIYTTGPITADCTVASDFIPIAPVPYPLALARTGQTFCKDATGNLLADCTGSGQDGEKLAGTAWPSPRFSNSDGSVPISGLIVLDNLTGLQWLRNAGTPQVSSVNYTNACWGGFKTWQGALEYIACLNSEKYLGKDDWRLPNRKEMESLINAGEVKSATWLNGQGFSNVQTIAYWTSTTHLKNASQAYYLNVSTGVMSYNNKTSVYYVWPVRGGQEPSATAPLAVSGQTGCYDKWGATIGCSGTGQDGELRSGIVWPGGRFTFPGGTTAANATSVIDNMTGLEWSRNGVTPSFSTCASGSKNWLGALIYIDCLNLNGYLGKSDWRLPNRTELESLINADQETPALWLTTQGFSSVNASGYWSSTTDASNGQNAWTVSMNYGSINSNPKTSAYPVWPVRTVGAAAVPVPGACGAASGAAASFAPTTDLCAIGSAFDFTGSGPWYWSCHGSNGGTNASCATSAPTQIVASTFAGKGGTIAPPSDSGAVPFSTAFTITAEAGYEVASVTGCGGTLSGNTYTTGTITSDCRVTAFFSLPGAEVKMNGEYRFVAQMGGLRTAAGGTVHTTGEGSTGSIAFDGTGGCSMTVASTSIEETAAGIAVSPRTDTFACSYAGDGAGTFLVFTDTENLFHGYFGTDGTLFTSLDAGEDGGGTGGAYRLDQLIGVKTGSGMSQGTLNGTYSIVSQENSLRSFETPGISKGAFLSTGTLSFDGIGGCAIDMADTDLEATNNNISLYTKSKTEFCNYAIDAGGHLTTSIGGNEIFSGTVSSGGGAILIGGYYQNNDGGSIGHSIEQTVAIRRGSNKTTADLNGSYGFTMQDMRFSMGTGGTVQRGINGGSGIMTFDGAGACSFSHDDADITEEGSGVSLSRSAGSDPCTYSVSTAGELSVSFGNGGFAARLAADNGSFIAGDSYADGDYGVIQLVAVKVSGSGSSAAGICGTAHSGTFTIAPITGLCAPAGSVPLTPTAGGWTWSCPGTNGGTPAACSATRAFEIAAGADSNGSISPAGATAVPYGSNKTYTVTPNPGFIVAALVVDGTLLPGATTYTFTNVTASHYINAYFAPAPPFTITAGSAGNGSIAPQGATPVPPGTSQTFYFTPDPGFAVMALVVDGTILPAATSYTFTGVSADHYLNAYFGAVISAGADSNGSISSPGETIVAAGDSKTYTITPNPGYRVAALVVDGTLLPGATSYTFTGVSTGHYINAYFEPAVTLTVTIDGSGSGTVNSSPVGILCESGSTANCAAPFPAGSRVELYAAAAASSLFSGWSNGCSGTGTCTIDPLTTATGVTATFTSNTKIKLAGTQALHATLQSAYTAAGDGETFLLQVYAFIENLYFSLPKSVKLKGGQNTGYDGTVGMTTIQGSLTVEQGSVEISEVMIW